MTVMMWVSAGRDVIRELSHQGDIPGRNRITYLLRKLHGTLGGWYYGTWTYTEYIGSRALTTHEPARSHEAVLYGITAEIQLITHMIL